VKSSTIIVLRREARKQAFVDLAAAKGWAFAGEEVRGHARSGYRAYRPAEGSQVAWCEHHTTGVRFLSIEDAPSEVAEIRAALPHFTREELLAAAAGAEIPGALDALRAFSLAEHGKLAPDLRALLVRWMGHENRIVRRAVLRVCALGGWRDLLPEIDQRIATDAELSEVWKRLAGALRGKNR
jgi:hypothetical protein